jgi:flagellar biosynthesis/type III secretory pathway protein FliH
MFHVEFAHRLSAVSVPGGRVQVQQHPAASPLPVKNFDAEAMAALRCLPQRLAEIESMLRDRLDLLQEQIARIAVKVARNVLNDDQVLIQKRVEKYVQIAFDQSPKFVPQTIHVHPDCAAAINDWVEKTGNQTIEVKADMTIAPGDCRVDSSASGIALMLDAYLDAVFEQLNADGIGAWADD